MATVKKVTLNEALPIWGIPRSTFAYWLDRGVLRSEFEPAQRPKPRNPTRENVLELAFFLRIFGTVERYHPAPMKTAADYTRDWLRAERKGKLDDIWVFDTGSWKGEFVDSKMTAAQLLKKFRPPAYGDSASHPEVAEQLILLNPTATVRRVDALFEASRHDP